MRDAEMTEMTVPEIQAVNLEMLSHIDAFCKARGIRYWLSYGTLLGAIRHHGFIPWDDDADIAMKREDYDRFVAEYVDSDKYRLYAPERKNSYLNYARLCEMKDTFFGQKLPWTNECPGVGVDVFPLDNAPDDCAEFERFAAELVSLRAEILKRRGAFCRCCFRKDLFGFVKDVVHAVVRVCCRVNCGHGIYRLLCQDSRLRKQFDGRDTKSCSNILWCTKAAIKQWRRSWFDALVEWDFCGKKLPVPIGYDAILRAEYGDYMKLPPEDQRGGHASCQTMMWRNK